jgi:hypothetical protein
MMPLNILGLQEAQCRCAQSPTWFGVNIAERVIPAIRVSGTRSLSVLFSLPLPPECVKSHVFATGCLDVRLCKHHMGVG